MDSARIFRGWNEWWNRIHVCGENDSRMRLLGERSKDIRTSTFNDSLACLIAQSAQFVVEEIAHRAFVAGDRFDVDQLPSEREDVFVLHGAERRHAFQNSARRAVRENIAA